MRILPLSIPLNENEIKIKNYSPSSLSIPQGALQLQLNCLKIKIGKLNFWARKDFFPLFLREKNIKTWMPGGWRPLLVQSHLSWTRLLINSPSQNEIVGRFPGRVHSRVVRLFPVWTPSKTVTVAIDLCNVNGLVAVHWPNLYKKRQVQYDAPKSPIPMTNKKITVIHPSDEQTAKHSVLSSHAISFIKSLIT
jgi:hypothetical protein